MFWSCHCCPNTRPGFHYLLSIWATASMTLGVFPSTGWRQSAVTLSCLVNHTMNHTNAHNCIRFDFPHTSGHWKAEKREEVDSSAELCCDLIFYKYNLRHPSILSVCFDNFLIVVMQFGRQKLEYTNAVRKVNSIQCSKFRNLWNPTYPWVSKYLAHFVRIFLESSESWTGSVQNIGYPNWGPNWGTFWGPCLFYRLSIISIIIHINDVNGVNDEQHMAKSAQCDTKI